MFKCLLLREININALILLFLNSSLHYLEKFKWLRTCMIIQFSSVQSLSPVRLFATHKLQHPRPPCPSPTPGVHPNSCPSSRWCHPAISSSAIPFSSCLLSLPVSESFPLNQFFTWGGQSTGVAALVFFLLKNNPLQHHSSKASILQCSAFFTVQLSHPYMTTGKTIALTRWTFVGKVMSLLFNVLSRLVITFLPRSKHLLISWLPSPSAVILEPRKIK